MRRSYFLLASLSLFSSTVFSQFESSDKQEQKKIDYSILDAEVGKDYWIKANPKAETRIEFSSDLGNYFGIKNKFVVTTDLKFTVIGWKLNWKGEPFFLLQFENGKSAYHPVHFLWENTKQVFNNIFDGTEYDDVREYLFNSEPDKAISTWQKKIEDERKRAEDENKRAYAEYQSKGGVRIGMTKAQVLKSNWGKPVSISRTIMANSTREQWVYSSHTYLYFTNNILTTIQN